MVRIFTHRKRTYWGYDRSRVDFKITVDHINFTSNQYFLANSHYVIFRKENKNKQFVSRNKVPTASELKMVHVDEKIKFRACLLQDTAHRYLEKFLPKLKRFVVRQVTETKDEELYVNCGHFELALDIYAMKPSGQDVTVNFVDPSGKASGTVVLKVEHEPRVVMGHYLPSISRSFKQLLTPTHAAKTRISQSRLDHNREKLEFVKKQRMVNHWSHKYDGLSDSESESEAGDTHSASGSSDDGEAKTQKRLPTKSFIMNRTGMPQMSTKGGSSKHHVSAMLRSHMFNFGEEEEGEETQLSSRPQENANRPEEGDDNKVSSVSFYESVTHFEPEDAKAKVMSSDTCSTLTHSEQNHLSPRVDPDAVIRRPELEPEIHRKPSVQMMKPTRLNMSAEAPVEQEPQEKYIHASPHSPHGAQVIGHLLPGNTHVPFANQSYKVRASSFLVCESADELSDAGNMPAIELKKEKPLPVVEEELWEDPADFDRLEESNDEELVLEGGSYKPRKSLRHVPPPLISDKSQFIPARSVQRSASMTSASLSANEANLPRYEPPAAVPQPPRKSLRGAPPPPVPEKESFVPARVVQRANSESTAATMDSREGREFKTAPSAYVPLQGLNNPPLMSYQSEYHTRSTEANKVRSPSPVVRHLVPVRLSAQESANLASHSMSPTSSASMPQQHQHTHHRAASTGDMYAGIGHRHIEDALSPPVSVKELRRNFERPPLVKDNSNGSGDKKFPPLSPKNLPAADPNIKFQRGNSEHSFSTLSTHTELDKPKQHHTRHLSNGAPAKVLVPVRLNSSQQEQAYRAQEAVRSPQSVASLSQAPSQRAPQEQNYGHGYREEPASRAHHQSHNNINQAHVEQHDRYQRYHEAQDPNYHNHSNVSPHMQHHSQSHGNMHQAAPHGQAYHPDLQHHNASHSSAEAPHTLHRAHTMAPPIRLKANDYVPPVYERYTENHHIHQHIHPGSHPSNSGSGSAYSSPRDGSYTARSMSSVGVSPPPAVYRGVYA